MPNDDILIEQNEKLRKEAEQTNQTLDMSLQKQDETVKAVKALEPSMKRIGSAAEFIEGFLLSIKGDKGDQGDVGPEPTDERLKKLITPLIPEPIKGEDGKDGYTPQKGVDYFDGAPGREGKDGRDGIDGKDADHTAIVREVINNLPKIKNGKDGKDGSPDTPDDIIKKIRSRKAQKGGLSYDDLRDLPNLELVAKQASKSIEIYDESGLVDGNLERLNFTGSGVVATSDGRGTITIVIPGGSAGNVYTETPSGSIDGNNTSFTVANPITTVFSFGLNGAFIHPSDYSIVGSTISFVSAPDATLAGTPFTIVYS